MNHTHSEEILDPERPSPSGPGRRLREERRAQELDLDEVAAQLHLMKRVVEQIERDDYSEIQSHVFAMGYLRNYARLLRLDPEPYVAAYTAMVEGAPKPPPVVPRAVPRKTPRRIGGMGLFLGLTLLLALVLFLGFRLLPEDWRAERPDEVGGIPPDRGVETPTPAPEGVSPIESPTPVRDDGPEDREPDAGAVALAGSLQGSPQANPPPEPAGEPEAAASPESDAPDAPPPEGPREEAPLKVAASLHRVPVAESPPPSQDRDANAVVLRFSGPCWVDIQDRSRTFKLFGEMKRGDRRVLGGTPPYSIILGNTSAVTLTIGDTPFDLSRVARGNVARFTLDPTQAQ